MWFWRKKVSPRRKQVRENIAADRLSKVGDVVNSGVVWSVLILIGFICVTAMMLALFATEDMIYWRPWPQIIALAALVTLISIGAAAYIYRYHRRIITVHTRTLAMAGLFTVLLALTKLGLLFPNRLHLATGTVITSAIILTIAYDGRFAMGMSLFYAALACLVANSDVEIDLFLTMAAGAITCCFSLREIRTRMKLMEVGTMAAAAVFIIAAGFGFVHNDPVRDIFANAGWAAGATLLVAIIIQALLPLIEKVFRIATSMTLLDYSDANQPLLKKLAMGAPGTFSHSLLIGSIAEAAAEAINANGLLCRVGAYYHDIGKIDKPRYFVENQMGTDSKHEQLSPAMSQLIIVGHVKDGIEMAKEYGLPAVLRQFIETHHGTTLVEYFYHEARKKTDDKQAPPSEAEFRYPGPKPQSKESAIVMLSDAVEGAVRSLAEITPVKIEAVVHNMAMKRLQDGQFDECELNLKELKQIELALSKALAAHYHGRIAYPKSPDIPYDEQD